ncbi:hypothetical protein [Arsenicibacter rosenii]|nr:hypothetical protein [Arsenicibacter rosenii]
MNILTAGDLKTHFSDALKAVQNGKEIPITYGKKRDCGIFSVKAAGKA